MNETSLESIMKCSKEAIARAYMCNNDEMRCPVEKCSFGYRSCMSIRPRDWEKVLNSEREKRGCLNPRS